MKNKIIGVLWAILFAYLFVSIMFYWGSHPELSQMQVMINFFNAILWRY